MGMFDFTDRVAVITGSTAGLGKGMARHFKIWGGYLKWRFL